MAPSGRIFISHASQERPLADAFVRLLRSAGVPPSNIFYSSRSAMGPITGGNWIAETASAIRDSYLVVALMSPAFLKSRYCTYELGAVWGGNLPFFPVAMPSLDEQQLDGIMQGVQVAKIDDEETLDRLFEKVQPVLSDGYGQANWNDVKHHFLRRELPALLDEMYGRSDDEDSRQITLPQALPKQILTGIQNSYGSMSLYKRDLHYRMQLTRVSPEYIETNFELSYNLVSIAKVSQSTYVGFTPGRTAWNYTAKIGAEELDVDQPDVLSKRGLMFPQIVEAGQVVSVHFSATARWNRPDANVFSTYMAATGLKVTLAGFEGQLGLTAFSLTPSRIAKPHTDIDQVYEVTQAVLPYQGIIIYWE